MNADLIVVGNKRMTGARRFRLGSVPNKFSHHAPCSVIIVRPTEDAALRPAPGRVIRWRSSNRTRAMSA